MPRRVAMLVALFAAAPAPAQTPPPPEKGPTTIDAEVIEGVGDVEVTARGSAEIKRDDLTIFGEVLRYNREFGRVEGEGGIRMDRLGDRFSGTRLRYSTVDDTGTLEEPNYLLQRREQPARGSAQRLEFLGKDRYRLQVANYTTCKPGQDDWRIEAEELELDYETEEGRARSARLRFFDATLWLPFASFPLEKRRKSGILFPYFSQSTSRGTEVGVPFYWNIAPERDATLVPITMSKRGGQLKSEFRYMDARYSGELKLEYMPDDRVFGRSRYGFAALHTQQFTPALAGRLDYNKVSDHRYFVDLASHVRQASVGNLPRDAYLTYGGGFESISYNWQARIQRFQTLQDPLALIVSPYHRVPQLNFGASRSDIGGLADARLAAEWVRFSHPTLVDGVRTSLNPTVSMPLLAPGWFATPRAGLRYAGYGLHNVAPGQDRRQDVSIPWLSVDSGLVFDRQVRWFGQERTQTLEPRLFYVYVPYRNQDQIPLFDTGLADFNYAQLFSENRFAGGDRFGDANQLTAALTSRLLGADGLEELRATLGRRYYFRSERVGLTPTSTLRGYSGSDLLGSVGGRITRSWTFDLTTQFNPREGRAERYGASVRYAPEIAKVLSASYRFNRNILRQIDVSGQWPVGPGWYAVGRYNYSVLDKRLLEGLGGIEYNAGCWVFRAVVQRIQTATQVSSTAFYLQLELTGIGQIGTGDATEFLKRNVPGYSVTNPRDRTLVPPSMRERLPFGMVF
ncbi:MAG: hypothetical protein A3D95_01330 [Betaproteobacteria bacterium RIFCSPHIGHO2_12_FULL_69_13]|nr:MAG: hypothetical protein A3D95_01330 [Betaproteobacteria bacterium RIFCSPHIGHO2_12_FULL_69_13]OGA64419.1 MAG: hypothetical protein A3G83_17160 [Betaproteobacteria bacterium RIFCSPLOWO2_12_FULL_68_20]